MNLMHRPAATALLVSCACVGLTVASLPLGGTALRAFESPRQASALADTLHRPLDQILDTNVRDGFVYYRALKSERGRLDRYANSLNVSSAVYESWPREEKMAFWVNAYNAFVLQTVVDRYPIRGTNTQYPPESIRQIPGAFETIKRRAAGRTVTLDDIEKTIIPEFKEPRLHLALGRGAVGSGRLKSEAYTGARIMQQLAQIQTEFVSEQTMLKIDRKSGEVSLTPIFSWHEAEFIAAYDKGADGPLAQRSPIERAAIAFIAPNLLPLEKELVQKNQFKVTYHPFDWRLNDLTGGRNQ
jgi:hypothetical protein